MLIMEATIASSAPEEHITSIVDAGAIDCVDRVFSIILIALSLLLKRCLTRAERTTARPWESTILTLRLIRCSLLFLARIADATAAL